jgi:hypothetical protein
MKRLLFVALAACALSCGDGSAKSDREADNKSDEEMMEPTTDDAVSSDTASTQTESDTTSTDNQRK